MNLSKRITALSVFLAVSVSVVSGCGFSEGNMLSESKKASPADKTELEQLISEILVPEDYTTEGYGEYEAALSAAEEVAKDELASEEDVDSASEALSLAKAALVPRSDCTKLKELIAAADKLDNDKYSETSLAEVTRLLPDARIAVADRDFPEEKVESLEIRLGYALDCLVAKPVLPADDSFAEGHYYSLGLPAGMTESPISKELSDALDAKVRSYGEAMSFIAYDLRTGFTVSKNLYDKFFCASTVKAPDVLYIFKELLDNGKASFADELVYMPMHDIGGAGSVQITPFGTRFTMRDITRRAICESDNNAYMMLLDKYTIEGYNEYIKSLGCTVAGNLKKYDKYGWCCAADAALIWKEIYTYTKSGGLHGLMYRDYLINAVAPVIAHGIDNGEYIAHKSGWSPDYYNDIAIIYGEYPYVIAIYSQREICTHYYLSTVAGVLSQIMDEYGDMRYTLPDKSEDNTPSEEQPAEDSSYESLPEDGETDSDTDTENADI